MINFDLPVQTDFILRPSFIGDWSIPIIGNKVGKQVINRKAINKTRKQNKQAKQSRRLNRSKK